MTIFPSEIIAKSLFSFGHVPQEPEPIFNIHFIQTLLYMKTQPAGITDGLHVDNEGKERIKDYSQALV